MVPIVGINTTSNAGIHDYTTYSLCISNKYIHIYKDRYVYNTLSVSPLCCEESESTPQLLSEHSEPSHTIARVHRTCIFNAGGH